MNASFPRQQQGRLRRIWWWLRHPGGYYDPICDAYLIPVSGKLVRERRDGWTEPLCFQLQYIGGGRPHYELVMRQPTAEELIAALPTVYEVAP